MKIIYLLLILMIFSATVFCQEADVELKVKEEEEKFKALLAEDFKKLLKSKEGPVLKTLWEDFMTLVKFEDSVSGFLEKEKEKVEQEVEKEGPQIQQEVDEFVIRRAGHGRKQKPWYNAGDWENTIGRTLGGVLKIFGGAAAAAAGG